jgi:hypothetical protein
LFSGVCRTGTVNGLRGLANRWAHAALDRGYARSQAAADKVLQYSRRGLIQPLFEGRKPILHEIGEP